LRGTVKRDDIAPAGVKAVERVETKIATFYAPPAPPSTEAAPTRAPQPKAQDRMEARNDAKRNDTTKLDTFIRELRAKLPTPVDRTTDLISVEEQANVVTLGFRVSELVPNLDAERFAASLQENIEANACKPSGNPGVRELNLDGVEFIFLYSDQADETLAEVRLPP